MTELLVSPTIHIEDGFVFYFFSYNVSVDEPPHVHVGERRPRARGDAKIWLNPVAVAASGRFKRREINRILAIVIAERQEMLEEWYDYQQHL